jgi:hypothetical protein
MSSTDRDIYLGRMLTAAERQGWIDGTGSIPDTVARPKIVMNYVSTRESRNIYHEIIGRSYPAVTTRPAQSRTGTLEFLFETEADSVIGENIHNAGTIVRLRHEGNAQRNMNLDYMVNGSVTRSLEPETRRLWTLTVNYREVRDQNAWDAYTSRGLDVPDWAV